MTDLPLFPGETILFETRQHWTVVKSYYALGFLLGALGLLLLPMMFALPNLAPIEKFLFGPLPIGVSIAVFAAAKLNRKMHEYLLTNQRLIVKTPLTNLNFYMDNVQAVSFRKALIGDYGWLSIATPSGVEILPRIERCGQLAALVEQQIMQRRMPGTATAAAAAPPIK